MPFPLEWLKKFRGPRVDMVAFKHRYPRRKLTREEQDKLKEWINYRLDNYDWECRLPKPKPRISYKLKTIYLYWDKWVNGVRYPAGTYWL